MRPAHLSKKHYDDLVASGLTTETIILSQARTETDPLKIAAILNWRDKDTHELRPARVLGTVLVFPFVDFNGNPTGYERVKPDRPLVHTGASKPAKYESPAGKTSHVYLTSRARATAADAAVPLFFTEGEKKALAADQAGFACVGLVGVWGWVKPRKRDGDGDLVDPAAQRELHADLDPFVFANRRVYIVFDSDAVAKSEVRYAEWEFAGHLAKLGARVKVVRLPHELGGAKVGLDDYLMRAGVPRFNELVADAGEATLPYFRQFSNSVQTNDPEKPGKLVPVPRSVSDIAAELVGRADGWPKVVSEMMVIPDRDFGVRTIDNHDQLFAFAGGVFDRNGTSAIRWDRSPSHAGRGELYHYLSQNCKRYKWADKLPHQPLIDGVLYLDQYRPTQGKEKWLREFLSFFNPATDADRALIVAAMATPLWGGPPGKRPAFLIQAADHDARGGRGVGKSTLVAKIARLYGGSIDVAGGEPHSQLMTRILTPTSIGKRILSMDNVKTFRLSSADLEGLVTNPDLNGKRLYRGQAAVPNYFTMFITLNGASLSADFAQRVVPISLARATMQEGWEAKLDELIEAHSRDIIQDLMAVLCRPAVAVPITRWGPWELEVMAKIKGAAEALATVAGRTVEMDADRDDADRIREMVLSICKVHFGSEAADARYLFDSPAITKIVCMALNTHHAANAASGVLRSHGLPEFRHKRRRNGAFWEWTGKNLLASQETRRPRLVSYQIEQEKWTVDSVQEQFLDENEANSHRHPDDDIPD